MRASVTPRVADHAIDAALCGYEYSGLAKLLNILEHRRFKQRRRPIRVLRETEVSVIYDGGNNVGMLAIYGLPWRRRQHTVLLSSGSPIAG